MITANTEVGAEYFASLKRSLYGYCPKDDRWYVAETYQELVGAGVPPSEVRVPGNSDESA